MEHSANTYRMKAEEHGHEENGHHSGRRGYQQRDRDGGSGRQHGNIIFYNSGQPTHFARDYHNPTMTCKYCKSFNHVIEECLILMERM